MQNKHNLCITCRISSLDVLYYLNMHLSACSTYPYTISGSMNPGNIQKSINGAHLSDFNELVHMFHSFEESLVDFQRFLAVLFRHWKEFFWKSGVSNIYLIRTYNIEHPLIVNCVESYKVFV